MKKQINKYRLVGMINRVDDDPNIDEQTLADYKTICEFGEEAFILLLDKYWVDSNNIEEFHCDTDYLFDEDADAIYLFHKESENNE